LDLSGARARIAYAASFAADGTRVTENLDSREVQAGLKVAMNARYNGL
jgi:hypothetical protein